LTYHLASDRDACRKKCEIGDDVVHLPAVNVERSSIHAPDEAVIDPVFDEVDSSAAWPVLGKAGVAPHPRQCGWLQPFAKVAARASK
jgi:hypothetical protein